MHCNVPGIDLSLCPLCVCVCVLYCVESVCPLLLCIQRADVSFAIFLTLPLLICGPPLPLSRSLFLSPCFLVGELILQSFSCYKYIPRTPPPPPASQLCLGSDAQRPLPLSDAVDQQQRKTRLISGPESILNRHILGKPSASGGPRPFSAV